MRLLTAALIMTASLWSPAASAQTTPQRAAEPMLAENSWDFTAPDGIPGFGPISAADVQRLLNLHTGARD